MGQIQIEIMDPNGALLQCCAAAELTQVMMSNLNITNPSVMPSIARALFVCLYKSILSKRNERDEPKLAPFGVLRV